jgi:glycosyltransferase involved in cell wall biosynthesis
MSNEPPLVTVVTPTYNRAHLLERSMRSVLDQTYRAVDLLIVDDGSTDDTTGLLERIDDPRVRVVRHATNRGALAAKNTGLDHLRGEYAIIFDSDDELAPDALERMVGTLEERGPDWGMVFADCVDPANGRVTGSAFPDSREVTYEDAICGRFTGEFVGLWRSSLADDLRFDERTPFGETLVWFRFYQRARVYYLHAPLRRYYRGPATTDAVSNVKFEDRVAYRRMAFGQQRFIEEFGADLERACRGRLGHQYRVLALYAAIAGDRASSFRAVTEAIRFAPTPTHAALLAMPLLPRPALRRLFAMREASRRELPVAEPTSVPTPEEVPAARS